MPTGVDWRHEPSTYTVHAVRFDRREDGTFVANCHSAVVSKPTWERLYWEEARADVEVGGLRYSIRIQLVGSVWLWTISLFDGLIVAEGEATRLYDAATACSGWLEERAKEVAPD
jgi:hypothetical protein